LSSLFRLVLVFRAMLRTIDQHDANKRINDERKVASS